ncbi:uncharacterized protein LOC122505427 [Leptopilina heterotoma]|uniref:uncharacterized protein LOC122505427 n=1 Tax=Leptopilina heterotoma TaxID=63436 RepID=UPI001CA8BFF9|nr:uncharacterized protein LOC122505427 [Leptopilina heterotoma]
MSSKTFLKTTSARYNIITIDDNDDTKGQLAYFGIEKGLAECINVKEYKSEEIWLIFNSDGLPLFKSGPGEFWPILCRIYNDPDVYDPFPVLIYHGNSKPKDLEVYLDEFINELNSILENGISISGKKFKVLIKCFTCDTLARAFLKKCKGHTGKNACERCVVEGKSSENRMPYSKIDCEERSDTSFRNKTDSEHHTGTSPLEKIKPKINMVQMFVLDIMHLLFLGVMKRLLSFWTTGSNFNVKLGRNQINEISRRMNYI